MFSTNHEFSIVCILYPHPCWQYPEKRFDFWWHCICILVFDYGWVTTYLDSFFMYYRIQHEYISFILQPLDTPNFLSDEPGLPPTKEKIVLHLLEFVDRGIISWCMNADLVQLCLSSHKQLLELKVSLLTASSYRGWFCGSLYRLVKELLCVTFAVLSQGDCISYVRWCLV